MKIFGLHIVTTKKLQKIYNNGFNDCLMIHKESIKKIKHEVNILKTNTWDKDRANNLLMYLQYINDRNNK